MRVFYPDFETLGILVCERGCEPPFAECGFLRRLAAEGSRTGLPVVAFDPSTWRAADNTVRGWTPEPDTGLWSSRRHPLPGLVYDRSWPENGETNARFQQALRRIEDRQRIRYLNAKLPDKAKVHAVLAGEAALQPLLPPADIYAGPASLDVWLDRHGGSAFLKPVCGSQGRRIAVCCRQPDGTLRVQGRRSDNRLFKFTSRSGPEGMERLHRWIGNATYLMQPLLELSGPDGDPFDIRALIQKNGRGIWTMTGTAVRSGLAGSLTANLHGGGSAEPAQIRLSEMFGPSGAEVLLQQIHDNCRHIVRGLEGHYGRFGELGLDFGVDRDGRLWFLEANSKPGRACMAAIGTAAVRAAAARPIAYARFILLRSPGRVIHDFDHL